VEVEHSLGTACVPADPQRIVALDPIGALPTLLALDAPVVGAAAVFSVGDPLPNYLDAADTDGIAIVGTSAEPNMEAIAALDPDLIVGSVLYLSAFSEKLEAIAPTVAVADTFYTDDFHGALASIAALVGSTDAFEADWARFGERQAGIAAELSDRYGSLTMTRVDGWGDLLYTYKWPCMWLGAVLSPLGITQPAAQGGDCDTATDPYSSINRLSLERIGELDADVIITYAFDDGTGIEGTSLADTLADNALWQALPAVRDGNVFEVGDAWGVGASLPAAEAMLDDIERLLLD